MMKCDLCNRILKYDEEIIEIKRKFAHGLREFEITGTICNWCYKNFHNFPNKIVFDGEKWWYISDPALYGENSKLTINPYERMAFKEFNPWRRIWEINTRHGKFKVSFYWMFKKGGIRKGPYFWNPNRSDVYTSPKQIRAVR